MNPFEKTIPKIPITATFKLSDFSPNIQQHLVQRKKTEMANNINNINNNNNSNHPSKSISMSSHSPDCHYPSSSPDYYYYPPLIPNRGPIDRPNNNNNNNNNNTSSTPMTPSIKCIDKNQQNRLENNKFKNKRKYFQCDNFGTNNNISGDNFDDKANEINKACFVSKGAAQNDDYDSCEGFGCIKKKEYESQQQEKEKCEKRKRETQQRAASKNIHYHSNGKYYFI